MLYTTQFLKLKQPTSQAQKTTSIARSRYTGRVKTKTKIQKQDERLKRRELAELIFKAIGAGLLIGSAFVVPTVPVAYGIISKLVKEFKNGPVHDVKIKRSIKALEKRGVISVVNKGSEVYVSVTDGNYEKVLRYSIKKLLDIRKASKTWNGKWYVVFFDVPEIQKNKRDGLRRFLKFIGFLAYQKSVYIFPFECRQEVELIKKIVESGKYLKYIVAEEIEDESRFRSNFSI